MESGIHHVTNLISSQSHSSWTNGEGGSSLHPESGMTLDGLQPKLQNKDVKNCQSEAGRTFNELHFYCNPSTRFFVEPSTTGFPLLQCDSLQNPSLYPTDQGRLGEGSSSLEPKSGMTLYGQQ